ncbi:hypothetical protein [Streptomyces sp. 7N604]|uniref:hypothetical protein n=1 Tax=Streptomyces sp. 7N604 TaxID=3457415 RepID=UPI003FD2FEE4
MAEPGTQTAAWAERMELLKDSAQQRVLGAPMPAPAMEQLLADGKAASLGRFEGSPIRYLDRWWRLSEAGWVALDEAGSAQLDLHAERYRAATGAVEAGTAEPAATAPTPRDTTTPPALPRQGPA